tara:strand:- start:342 stop:881 length:540 start_codon:yes stop_codon:yes gene_type:complete
MIYLISVLFFINILNSQVTMENTIHQFKVEDIYGDVFDFSNLKGKKIMIVNTASKCGLTPQYEKLQSLHEKYGDEKFIIVGFPSNNFLFQEPGSNEEISTFCKSNYGVSFPMMSKISVIGNDKHPVYKFLTEKEKNGVLDSRVTWNFQKYLLDEDGKLNRVISPRIQPDDKSIIDWILN